ncbi:hypothetical protein NDU88_011029 [Pleurodeles waltl]|uniref:Uncharacterized protein n=1 Tax=Pleurodeles waltl TaxID=8319 RepID=A0AAV7QW17_PLEWA|nr:hypothetical protein NDU88_011029 [Pleurodeles waltl]
MYTLLLGCRGLGRERSAPGVLRDCAGLWRKGQGRFQTSHAGKTREVSEQEKRTVTQGEEEAINGRRKNRQETEERADKQKRRSQEMQHRGLEGESYILATVRHGSPEKSSYQEMTEGEDALEQATF